jgi:ABC-2 type transport system ATP-binding protein
VIQAEHLTMTYGATKALDDASFEVKSGEVLGLLGPNGAGKTTTLKILTTFIVPTSGRVVVDGVDALEEPLAVRRRIGYLPETAPLYADMMVDEYLGFVGRARGVDGARLAERKTDVVHACGLEGVLTRPIAHLSKGFRQRTGLAGALIHDPDILILDEPTSGLDPLQILGIRDLIKRLARTKTVLFSTHILQEIEAVSDRVMIINEGRIIAEGTPGALQQRAMEVDCLAVEVGGDGDGVDRTLASVPGVLAVDPRPATRGGAAFSVRHGWGDEAVPVRVEEALRRSGRAIRRFDRDRYTLEQVFISLTKASGRAAGGAS